MQDLFSSFDFNLERWALMNSRLYAKTVHNDILTLSVKTLLLHVASFSSISKPQFNTSLWRESVSKQVPIL